MCLNCNLSKLCRINKQIATLTWNIALTTKQISQRTNKLRECHCGMWQAMPATKRPVIASADWTLDRTSRLISWRSCTSNWSTVTFCGFGLHCCLFCVLLSVWTWNQHNCTKNYQYIECWEYCSSCCSVHGPPSAGAPAMQYIFDASSVLLWCFFSASLVLL